MKPTAVNRSLSNTTRDTSRSREAMDNLFIYKQKENEMKKFND